MEKLVKARHLRRYIKEADHIKESGPVADKILARVTTSSKPSLVINYILGGPSDDQYQSKHQQKKNLRAATVKARVNDIRKEDSREETRPIDGPVSLPPVNPNMIIVPHYDALLLTLCISHFDLHRVLVDSGSATDLLQVPPFNQMRLSLGVLNSFKRILSYFNGATIVTLGDVTLPIRVGPVTQ